jgi:outer membrane protein OmpA-like peptidoglycan-associated protein
VRPFADDAIGGPWISLVAGGAQTGGLTRPMFDAGVGYDIAVSRSFGVGPMVGYLQVVQPDDELRPADGRVILLGIHASYAPARDDDGPGDRDGDGILDPSDRCPDDPEDKDGFEDQDGCPDPDNDRDRVLDLDDACPIVAEDRDGFEDDDGCPDNDNDEDGLADAIDRCPNDPEDKDGFEDDDGCPDRDNDEDGLADAVDQCPNEPETKNGYADDDGCPDEEQVRVVGDRIVLDDRIHFATNSARIRPASFPLLERLAKLIQENPSYVHIGIQGHADERGPEWFNLRLSKDRAKSVLDFLVQRGIAAERLSYDGFGTTRPLVDRKDERAWFMNRRVEFEITREMRDVRAAKRGNP